MELNKENLENLENLYIFIKFIKQFSTEEKLVNLDTLLNNSLFNSINKDEIEIPPININSEYLIHFIKKGIEYFVKKFPEKENLLDNIKKIFKKPNIKIIEPINKNSNIDPIYNIFSKNLQSNYFNILISSTKLNSQNTSIRHNLKITHYLLDYSHVHNRVNSLYGLYYHNPNIDNRENIQKIKNLLTSNKNKLERNLAQFLEKNNKNENEFYIGNNFLYKVKIAKIEKIESAEFWSVPRYFIINRIEFIFNKLNKFLKIRTFNSILSKKGSGHELLCILLYLFQYKNIIDIEYIELIAGSDEVMEKFYIPIGFDCNRKSKICTQTFIKLKEKCINIPDIKLILKYNNVYIDNLEIMLNLINI